MPFSTVDIEALGGGYRAKTMNPHMMQAVGQFDIFVLGWFINDGLDQNHRCVPWPDIKEDTLMLCNTLKRFPKHVVVLGTDYKLGKPSQEWDDRRILSKSLIQSQGIPVLDGVSLHLGIRKRGKEKERSFPLSTLR